MSEAMDRPRRAKGESMAAYRARREGYVAAHRDTRNGNRVKLAQHDDALAYLLEPAPLDLDTALDQALADDNLNGDVFSGDEDISARQQVEAERDEAREALAIALEDVARLKREKAELEAREPEVRTVEVEKIVERVVEVPAPVVVEAAPSDGIPDEFRGLIVDGESPERFTERMKRRWQALQHLRIDGSKPTNSRALPDMTEEEIAELADLEARNKTAKWLD